MLRSYQRAKTPVEYEWECDINLLVHLKRSLRVWKMIEGIGNRNHTYFSIVEFNKNTHNSPGDPKKLAVTQTSGKTTILLLLLLEILIIICPTQHLS